MKSLNTERAAAAAAEIANLWRGWFLQKTSEENCMTTIVDVFTDMRTELEDDEIILPPLNAIIAKHFNDDALRLAAERLVNAVTQLNHITLDNNAKVLKELDDATAALSAALAGPATKTEKAKSVSSDYISPEPNP